MPLYATLLSLIAFFLSSAERGADASSARAFGPNLGESPGALGSRPAFMGVLGTGVFGFLGLRFLNKMIVGLGLGIRAWV